MNPTSNQMNSMYQSPLGQQPTHKTSIVSIVVLLLITIIVAVLGFGRINNMKDEQAKIQQQQDEQARSIQMQNQEATAANDADDSVDVMVELEAMDGDTNEADIETMESAF